MSCILPASRRQSYRAMNDDGGDDGEDHDMACSDDDFSSLQSGDTTVMAQNPFKGIPPMATSSSTRTTASVVDRRGSVDLDKTTSDNSLSDDSIDLSHEGGDGGILPVEGIHKNEHYKSSTAFWRPCTRQKIAFIWLFVALLGLAIVTTALLVQNGILDSKSSTSDVVAANPPASTVSRTGGTTTFAPATSLPTVAPVVTGSTTTTTTLDDTTSSNDGVGVNDSSSTSPVAASTTVPAVTPTAVTQEQQNTAFPFATPPEDTTQAPFATFDPSLVPAATPTKAPAAAAVVDTKAPVTDRVDDTDGGDDESDEDSLLPLFLNAGGEENIRDSNTNLWVPDTDYAIRGRIDDPNFISADGCPRTIVDAVLESEIYCTARYGNGMTYEIPTGDGDFVVTLYLYNTKERTFDILLEGEIVHTSMTFDRASVATIPIKVQDGVLSIAFSPIVGTARISALAVRVADDPGIVTYRPGHLVTEENGLILSAGLTSRVLGEVGRRVPYSNGRSSQVDFHTLPDAGACFVDESPDNVGGWIYVSNSEAVPERGEDGDKFPGGVGAFTFDSAGNVLHYEMILEDTRMNCGGGTTPWGAWISGEEHSEGLVWQVDPTGQRPAERITLGEAHPGYYESFAHDLRNKDEPHFFMTRDFDMAPVRRFIPKDPNWDDPWSILTGEGLIEYLMITPSGPGSDAGTYEWVTNHEMAELNSILHAKGTEGIDVVDSELLFVSKSYKTLFILNLDDMTYTNQTTRHGLLDGQPDQVETLLGDNSSEDILYFTEDGGKPWAGLHGRNRKGQFFTILESHEYSDETTGLSFSPDGMHLYIAYQVSGILFDVTRTDGLPFTANTLQVKFHRVND